MSEGISHNLILSLVTRPSRIMPWACPQAESELTQLKKIVRGPTPILHSASLYTGLDR
uniref:Uncharacterized protein n=1 Tax=Arundo donax TaxID=35708 RepID=A0A0A9H4K3_ARUDO